MMSGTILLCVNLKVRKKIQKKLRKNMEITWNSQLTLTHGILNAVETGDTFLSNKRSPLGHQLYSPHYTCTIVPRATGWFVGWFVGWAPNRHLCNCICVFCVLYLRFSRCLYHSSVQNPPRVTCWWGLVGLGLVGCQLGICVFVFV